MQSNIDLVRDDLNDFPDSWVELYNTTNASVDLRNWILSDVNDPNKGWVINSGSSQTIPANGYLLLYCDKQDVGKGLHATFRLESGNNGGIYLYNASKQLVSSVSGNDMPKQPAPNISRGLTSGGTWAWFVEATPRAANTTKTATQLLPNPVFSIKGGVYKSTQTLTLSLPANAPSGSAIYYTTNGDEPTSSSTRYTNPISISTATSIRAKIVHSDYLTNRSVTHSYIVVASNRNFTLPVISISTSNEYLTDNKFGIYVRGDGTNGVTGNCVTTKVNWNQDWRRPMNVEYFPSQSSEAVLNQLGELRLAGGCSRQNAMKSLILYSNKRFGENKRYDYPLFSQKGGQEIKSFMLRNSGNDWGYTHIRDAAMQLFMGRKVDVDYQEYQPTAVYVNGVYRGIHNMRERSTDDYVLANYATEDIDMVENWLTTTWRSEGRTKELKVGDWVAFDQLLAELKKSTVDYQWLYDNVDINEYINYMILQLYVGNKDFPDNNVVLWRKKNGGKWRFIFKDLDQGLNLYGSYASNLNPFNHNASQMNGNNFANIGTTDDKLLFSKLVQYEPFQKEFYSRFAVYMGNLLHPTTTTAIIDSIQALVEPEMTYHAAATGISGDRYSTTVNTWKDRVNTAKNWITGAGGWGTATTRNTHLYGHLRTQFSLGTVIPLTLARTDNPVGSDLAVSINGVTLDGAWFDGSYFAGQPLTLKFENKEDWNLRWEIKATINSQVQTIPSSLRAFTYNIPSNCTKIEIKILGNHTPIEDVAVGRDYTFSVTEGSLYIGNITSDATISIYDISGKLLHVLNPVQSSVQIPFSQNGIYVVRIKDKDSQVTRKVKI